MGQGGRGGEPEEVVNEDAMDTLDRGVCEMGQIYGDIAGRKDELRIKNKSQYK
jgi:hypothetical protein